jgi:hypothetical protein
MAALRPSARRSTAFFSAVIRPRETLSSFTTRVLRSLCLSRLQAFVRVRTPLGCTMSAPAAKKLRSVWWVDKCPLEHECTESSWGKYQKCKSRNSEEQTRGWLYDHLSRSSYHKKDNGVDRQPQEFKDIADSTDVHQDVEEWFEEDPQGEPQMSTEELQKQIAAMKKQLADLQTTKAVPKVSRPPPSGPPPLALLAGSTKPVQMRLVPDDDTVTVSRSALRHVLDVIDRAEASAQHAVSISTTARTAFEKEAAKLHECGTDIRRLLDKF